MSQNEHLVSCTFPTTRIPTLISKQSYLNHQLQEARHNLELARINVYTAQQEAPEVLQYILNTVPGHYRMSAAQSYLHNHYILRLYDATYGATMRSLESRVRHCRNQVVQLRERELREAGAAGGGLGV